MAKDDKTINGIIGRYTTNLTEYRGQRKRIEKQLERLRNREKALECPSWIEGIIRPIAELMMRKLPNRTYDILGPFGIGARTSIHFYKKGIDRKNKFEGDNCLSITFEPVELDKGKLMLVDYIVNLHRYVEGSIGEMNGFNYPTVPMKDTVRKLMSFFRVQNGGK